MKMRIIALSLLAAVPAFGETKNFYIDPKLGKFIYNGGEIQYTLKGVSLKKTCKKNGFDEPISIGRERLKHIRDRVVYTYYVTCERDRLNFKRKMLDGYFALLSQEASFGRMTPAELMDIQEQLHKIIEAVPDHRLPVENLLRAVDDHIRFSKEKEKVLAELKIQDFNFETENDLRERMREAAAALIAGASQSEIDHHIREMEKALAVVPVSPAREVLRLLLTRSQRPGSKLRARAQPFVADHNCTQRGAYTEELGAFVRALGKIRSKKRGLLCCRRGQSIRPLIILPRDQNGRREAAIQVLEILAEYEEYEQSDVFEAAVNMFVHTLEEGAGAFLNQAFKNKDFMSNSPLLKALQARELYTQQKYPESAKLTLSLIHLGNFNPLAYIILGLSYVGIQQPLRGAAVLSVGIRKVPSASTAYYLGLALERAGYPEAAVSYLKRAALGYRGQGEGRETINQALLAQLRMIGREDEACDQFIETQKKIFEKRFKRIEAIKKRIHEAKMEAKAAGDEKERWEAERKSLRARIVERKAALPPAEALGSGGNPTYEKEGRPKKGPKLWDQKYDDSDGKLPTGWNNQGEEEEEEEDPGTRRTIEEILGEKSNAYKIFCRFFAEYEKESRGYKDMDLTPDDVALLWDAMGQSYSISEGKGSHSKYRLNAQALHPEAKGLKNHVLILSQQKKLLEATVVDLQNHFLALYLFPAHLYKVLLDKGKLPF